MLGLIEEIEDGWVFTSASAFNLLGFVVLIEVSEENLTDM